MRRLSVLSLAVAVMLAGAGVASADLIDFEGVPLIHYFFGGGTNLGSYYPGVSFGPAATILDQNIWGNGWDSAGYPPHSGTAVLFSFSTPSIRADFTQPSTHVEVWYTATTSFYLEAYDSGNTLVDSDSGASNYRSNTLLSVDGASIAYVIMRDTGNSFTVDDFGFTPIPAPGAALLGMLGLPLVAWFKRRL